ncbi:MAG: hypothetical protein Q9217_003299 [Psora testacea]
MISLVKAIPIAIALLSTFAGPALERLSCLRRAAFRVLSSSPSACISNKPRAFGSFTSRTPGPIALKPFTLHLQRRWLADEAATTQFEPEAAEAVLTADADNSIANASESADPPKTEEQAAEAVAEAPTPTDTTSPEVSSATSTVTDATKSAAESARDVASEAASTAAGATAAAGQNLAEAAGIGKARPDGEPSSTVYVGNLFFDVRSDDLKREFERAGPVVDARIITDQRGLSKGFGYVEFADVGSATKAISLYNLQNFEGRRLSVQYSLGRSSPHRAGSFHRNQAPLHPPTKTLFIGNMSFDMSDRDLNNLFREVKNVIDVRVAIDRRTGQPRGFAHADFTDIKSAEQAIEDLRGKMVCGRALRVDYSTSTGRAALGNTGTS